MFDVRACSHANSDLAMMISPRLFPVDEHNRLLLTFSLHKTSLEFYFDRRRPPKGAAFTPVSFLKLMPRVPGGFCQNGHGSKNAEKTLDIREKYCLSQCVRYSK